MYYYIKEWPNKMATLMTADGVVLSTFKNIEEAQKVWCYWRLKEKESQKPIHSSSGKRQTPKTITIEPHLEIQFHSPSFSEWLKILLVIIYTGKIKN